jgi:hypothetical protein
MLCHDDAQGMPPTLRLLPVLIVWSDLDVPQQSSVIKPACAVLLGRGSGSFPVRELLPRVSWRRPSNSTGITPRLD